MTRRWLPLGPNAVPNGQFGTGSATRLHAEGHGVVSGRVSAIAFSRSGDTIYVGAASGGLWQSSDEGAHWTPSMDEAPSLAVGSIAVANNDRIYVGTGEANGSGPTIMKGVGILFSDDGGTTWSLLSSQLTPPMATDLLATRIGRLVVHPNRPHEIYAATSFGLFVMVENPNTHALEWAILSRGDDCCDVAVDFTHPDKPRVWAAFNGSDVLVCNGDPLNTTLSVADRFQLKPAGIPVKAQGRVALALGIASGQKTQVWAAFEENEHLQAMKLSRDDGATWDDAPDLGQLDGSKQLDYNLLLAVDPNKPSRVYFGTQTLWRRDGSSWHDVSGRSGLFGLGSYPGIHADQHALAFHPTNANIVWAGNDGGVYRSDDGGEHFYPRNRGLGTLQFYSLDHDETQPAVLLGGTQDNGSLRYLGHPAWRVIEEGDGTFAAIEPHSPRDWYIGEPSQLGVGHAGPGDRKEQSSFHKSNDGLPSGVNLFRSKIACAPSEPGTIFFAPVLSDNTEAALYWSHGSDGHGSKWEKIDPTDDPNNLNDVTAVVVAPSDATIVYFGRDSNELFRLQLQGGTWNMTTIPGTPHSFSAWQQIVVDPNNPDIFFAVLGSTDGPPGDPVLPPHRIWRGTPAGVTPLPDLPDVVFPSITIPSMDNNVNAIALDPANPGTIYVGTDYGVYQLVGAGPWQRFSDGLPQAAMITALRLHPSRRLRVATMGRGVWECALDEPDRNVDIYIRDSVVDIGRADEAHETPESAEHPFDPSDIHWTDGIDIKLDTERRFIGGFESLGSENYDGVLVDYVGFEELDSDDPRSRAQSRVFVQVHNRGPEPVSNVLVRVYMAVKEAAGYPALPAGFWETFPHDGFDSTHWRALDTWWTIDDLRAGAPKVARFDSSFSGANDTIGLLAVVSCNDDPLPSATLPLDVETAARSDKHVALKEVTVDNPSYAIALLTLAILGVVATGIVLAET